MSMPLPWCMVTRFLNWTTLSSLKRRCITEVKRCIPTSLCFGLRKATPATDVEFHSLGVSLFSACRDSCSSLRSRSIARYSKIVWFGLPVDPQSLQAAVSYFPIRSRYVSKLPWLLSAMTCYRRIYLLGSPARVAFQAGGCESSYWCRSIPPAMPEGIPGCCFNGSYVASGIGSGHTGQRGWGGGPILGQHVRWNGLPQNMAVEELTME